MKKKIVILSGGLDSTTLLYDIVDKFKAKNVIALSFNYGSKHNTKELPMAAMSCDKLGVEHQIINLTDIFQHFDSALLRHSDSEEIPEGHYADENMSKTVVPFRNGILLSIAVGFAENKDCDIVYYGAHAGDHDIYPDCRKQFVDAISNACRVGTYNNVDVIASYWEGDKQDIIKRGTALDVDYKSTWTCYNPSSETSEPCGKCGSCVERTLAFYHEGKQDPLYSLETWKDAVVYSLEKEQEFQEQKK